MFRTQCQTSICEGTRLLIYLGSDRTHEKLPVKIGTGDVKRRSYVPQTRQLFYPIGRTISVNLRKS